MPGASSATPWAELQQLATADKFKGHYLANPRNMAEVQPEYTELARIRRYEPDGRRVTAAFDDSLAHFGLAGKGLGHAGEQVYGFLEAIGAKMIPHGSQGVPDYTSVIGGVLARGEGEIDHGHFFDHLVGNEHCLREWQHLDGPSRIGDAVCLAGLLHSLYGTQGYQASQFPFEKRAEIAGLVGKRAERLVFWNCAMERSSWLAMVRANAGLKRGETPAGHFSGRRSALGKEVPTPFSGEELWQLTAEEFTDMCALQLSHDLKQANYGATMAMLAGNETLEIMAQHLGGAALEQYHEEMRVQREDGTEVPDSFALVDAAAEDIDVAGDAAKARL